MEFVLDLRISKIRSEGSSYMKSSYLRNRKHRDSYWEGAFFFFLFVMVGLWVLRPLLAYCTSLG
jgi:hypothetical protein